MTFHLLNKSCAYLAVPGLYFYYFNKQNKVNAKELGLDDDKLLNSSGLQSKTPRLVDQLPISLLKRSKNESRSLIEAFRVIKNAPGVVCGVSYQGKELWAIGEGLADIETRAPCTDDSVMRIASISKSFMMLLFGKLLEEGKIDLDKPVSHYLTKDQWPEKRFENEKVDITLRQLVAHLGGIRHFKYSKNENVFDSKELYINEFFESVYESLKLFKDDELLSKPGTKWHYSTFGFILISAVLQSVLEKDQKVETELIKLLNDELRMYSTFLDSNEPIIPNRAKYYIKKKSDKCELINVKEINNSYKWTSAGLLSNVHDLLKYGNAMLYSYKTSNGILKQETMRLFWQPNELTYLGTIGDLPFRYGGMGWQVVDKKAKNKYKGYERMSLNSIVLHSGIAIGCTSLLIILPEEELVVAIITNLNGCQGIGKLAMDIAKCVYQNLEDIDVI